MIVALNPIRKILTPVRCMAWLPMLILPLMADAAQKSSPVVLDKVVAVVNKRAILASDIEDEISLSVLDATKMGEGQLTRQRALEELISRTLVEQQIREGEAEAAEPIPTEVDARVADLRTQLPACVHYNCATESGWKAFLKDHGLTQQRVRNYIRYRMEILNFIEQRFRPGIRISRQEIETYYRDTLVPQYRQGETIPSLDAVAPRIEEILLEQQVNSYFDQWLNNLRSQGNVEILDPDLESGDAQKASTR